MGDKNNNKIIPSAIFMIGEWFGGGVMKCKDLSGGELFLKFDSLDKKTSVNQEAVMKFFEDKMESMVGEKEILKVKNHLEEDVGFEEKIEEMGLSRKEEREFLKEESIKIVKDNWKINSGKWMRGALSESSETIEFDGNTYPVFYSKTIISDSDGNPSKSGLYYISKNQYNLPVIGINIESGGDVWLNQYVASKDNFDGLIRHSIRTAEKKIDFLVEFESREADYSDLCGHINHFKKTKNYKRYIDGCNYILNLGVEDIASKIFVKLPRHLGKSMRAELIQSDSNSMINTLSKGVENIYLSKLSDIEKEEAISDFKGSFNDENKVFGFYDIVNVGAMVEPASYGFLTNNLNPRKTFFDVETILSKLDNVVGVG